MAASAHAKNGFVIEGSSEAMQRLVAAIQTAIAAAARTPGRTGRAQIATGGSVVQIEVRPKAPFRIRATNRTGLAASAEGFAEPKSCIECHDLVALLIDDAYMEIDGSDDVICCDCWRKREEAGSAIGRKES